MVPCFGYHAFRMANEFYDGEHDVDKEDNLLDV